MHCKMLLTVMLLQLGVAAQPQLGPPDAQGLTTLSPDKRLAAIVDKTARGSKIRILRRSSGRVLFSRRLRRGYVQLQWSNNSRSLAIFNIQGETPDVNRLLVWSRGKRSLDLIGNVTGNGFLAGEPLFSMLWSPDNRWLLLHIPGAQGNYDFHNGALWCVNVGSRSVRLVNSSATRAKWTGSRSVSYWYRPWLALPESPHLGPEKHAFFRCK
jgi:hypothetical protein